MRIWKWTLKLTPQQTLDMPVGAQPLAVQVQGGQPQLWALCDEAAPREQRTFAIYGTGIQMPDDPGKYVATFQVEGGALVFHVFET